MKNKASSTNIYFYLSLFCFILLFVNYYRTDSLTGDKPFSEFAQHDWHLLTIFLIEEIVIVCVMLFFWFLGKRSVEKQKTKFIDQWEQDKLLGIEPGDYANVWFDFVQIERAVIIKHKNVYHLSIHKFDDRTKNWGNIHGVSVYDSLEAVRVSLFYDFDFYCEQNAVLDEHGNARFKECYNFE